MNTYVNNGNEYKHTITQNRYVGSLLQTK